MRPLVLSLAIGESARRIAFVDCPDYVKPHEVADNIYRSHRRLLESIELVAIRPRVDQPWSSGVAGAEYEAFAERLPHAAVHLVYSDRYEHKVSENLNAAVRSFLGNELEGSAFLAQLRTLELQQHLVASSALFDARRGFVYRAPSGQLCERFLRVGSVQTSRHVLDSFFFWMIPYLKGCKAMLTDTWSISSMSLNAARLLERYDAARRPFRVDMLSAYHGGRWLRSKHTRDAIRDALTRVTAGNRDPVLVLLSAARTGASHKELQRTIRDEGFNPSLFSFLALFKLATACEITSLCDLSAGLNGARFDKTPSRQSTVVEIDPFTYFPLHVQERERLIKVSAARHKAFFSQYQGTGVVTVHRDAVGIVERNGVTERKRLRHHGIFVDVSALLRQEAFRTRAVQILEKLPRRPFAIIVPPHEQGSEFARWLIKRLGQDPALPLIVHPNLQPEKLGDESQRLTDVAGEDVLLIIDDVSVTGRRLSDYQQNLRRIGFRGLIFYLVGVARPTSLAEWEARTKELRLRNTDGTAPHVVQAVETVVLPDLNEEDCSWCEEERLLKQILEDGSLQGSENRRAAIAKRLAHIADASQGRGLSKSAIWRLRKSRHPHLTKNSLFLDCAGNNMFPTDADVLSAVASALQNMRTEDHEPLGFRYPDSVVLAQRNYLGTRFNDLILRLALIRMATRDELRRWSLRAETQQRRAMKSLLQGEFATPAEGDAARLELMLAALGDKLPPWQVSDLLTGVRHTFVRAIYKAAFAEGGLN